MMRYRAMIRNIKVHVATSDQDGSTLDNNVHEIKNNIDMFTKENIAKQKRRKVINVNFVYVLLTAFCFCVYRT